MTRFCVIGVVTVLYFSKKIIVDLRLMLLNKQILLLFLFEIKTVFLYLYFTLPQIINKTDNQIHFFNPINYSFKLNKNVTFFITKFTGFWGFGVLGFWWQERPLSYG